MERVLQSIEGWTCWLLESKDIRSLTHDCGQIKSSSISSLLLDFVFLATRALFSRFISQMYAISTIQDRGPSKISPWPTGWETLSYNKNTVAFSDLEQYSCFVSVSIQSFRNQIAIEYTSCASFHCSHAKQIKENLMSLNNKQKSLCHMATT